MNTPNLPQIRKAKKIVGKHLVFRDASPDDASFILMLRTDPQKSKHISFTPPTLDQQVSWLEIYSTKDDQAYFIIENLSGEKLGTVRLYDAQGDDYCWGSWILKGGAPQSVAIESALMVYSYAIDNLGFNQAHFDVRKENEGVWRFHERFGAERVGENEHEYQYQISNKAIAEARQRYKKYLSNELVIGEING